MENKSIINAITENKAVRISTLTFICLLPLQAKFRLYKAVKEYLIHEGYKGIELYNIIRNAMDGRITDLEDCIDVRDVLVSEENIIVV